MKDETVEAVREREREREPQFSKINIEENRGKKPLFVIEKKTENKQIVLSKKTGKFLRLKQL